ncbi:MAG: hypothetical protein KatS3mg104_2306 [Phycisphaerae bacterium]|jgi:multidrug efflux pump subunit AcrA (membrane-fusion protein)|nr:MAG: hypothetical protein KatS3mg104_2306 [Phycisphaerae bacterium]
MLKGKSLTKLLLYPSVALVGAMVGWWVIQILLSPKVTVTRVTNGPVVSAFYATGTVRPEREYPIRTPVQGTVEQVMVDKGDPVRAGQTLAVVTDPQLKFRAERAKAILDEKIALADEKRSPILSEFDTNIRVAEQLVSISQREVDRLTQMAATSAASSVDLDRAVDQLKTRWAQLESLKSQRRTRQLELNREVEVARADYEMAVSDINQQILKSPIDGVVLDRPTSQGTRVAINDILMRVANVTQEHLVMRASVDEEDVTHCRIGQAVKMSLYAFERIPLTGKVTRIYPEADPDRRTFEVDVRFDDPPELLSSGMTGELAFILAEKRSARVLPTTAVQNDRIYVVREGRIAELPAKIGIRSIERVEIIEGVSEDDRVVISPIGNLSVGHRVRTHEISPQEASGLVPTREVEVNESAFKGFN